MMARHRAELWSQRAPIAIQDIASVQSQSRCVILCTDLKMMNIYIYRERERRQNVSLHECMHIHLVMVPHGNFYKLCHTTLRNFWTKGRLNSQPRRPAAGRTEDAAQAALPPDKHKAVRTSTKPSGGRWALGANPRSRDREAEKGSMSTAKSPRCLAGVKDDNGKSSAFLKPRMEKTSNYVTMPIQLPSRTFPWSSLATAGWGTVVKAGLWFRNDLLYYLP